MSQSTEPSTIWLTQDAFDKLEAELEGLKGPVRQEIIARISSARDTPSAWARRSSASRAGLSPAGASAP
jgi:hypothetical protein